MGSCTVRWSNHTPSIKKCLEESYITGKYTDVVIACHNHLLKAHKVVLAGSSSYFDNLFSMCDAQNLVIAIEEVSYPILKSVLDFMYKGEVTVNPDDLHGLLKAGITLRVRGLEMIDISDILVNGQSRRSHPLFSWLRSPEQSEDNINQSPKQCEVECASASNTEMSDSPVECNVRRSKRTSRKEMSDPILDDENAGVSDVTSCRDEDSYLTSTVDDNSNADKVIDSRGCENAESNKEPGIIESSQLDDELAVEADACSDASSNQLSANAKTSSEKPIEKTKKSKKRSTRASAKQLHIPRVSSEFGGDAEVYSDPSIDQLLTNTNLVQSIEEINASKEKSLGQKKRAPIKQPHTSKASENQEQQLEGNESKSLLRSRGRPIKKPARLADVEFPSESSSTKKKRIDPFIVYAKQARQSLCDEHPGEAPREIMKRLRSMWRELDVTTRQQYAAS